MRFLANENFPLRSILLLRKAEIDITSIGEDNPSITDKQVMQLSEKEHRTIITFDKDYGELVFRHGFKPSGGVIFLRIEDFKPDEPAKIILNIIDSGKFRFEGFFTVISEENVRQKKI
jgi:predicted nuclease of predicted toxin-antitoxin system